MFKTITAYIKHNIDPHLQKPILQNTPHIIVGLSGGPDSVFLLYYCKHLQNEHNIKLTAIHINHGWRKEANQDEEFCKTLCKKLEIPLITKHATDLEIVIKANGSQEEIGRKLRRHFFSKVRKTENADYVALAHHQQDQQETFFIRLLRGCSLSGLTAMKPVHGFYIRPLLTTSKNQILANLAEQKIAYVTDHTNDSDKYLRNRIRKHVIPALKNADHRFDQKFETSLKALQEEEKLLDTLTQKTFKKIFDQKENLLIGNKQEFLALTSPLQKRILILWLCTENVPFSPSSAHLDEIVRFISNSRSTTHTMNKKWAITKKREIFWIDKHQ